MGTHGGEELETEGESPAAAGSEKIFVSVRVRPLNGKEIAKNDVSDWGCISDTTIIYKNANVPAPDRSMYPSAYTFDRVFSGNCSTRQVYEEGAKEVALSVISGINSSIFAYGQTSSGKTYTMTGITEYTIADVYDYIQKHTDREFLLKFSAMEIYNESVRDLLSADSTPLRLLDDPERGTIVEKLTEETLRDWDHVMELLSICEAQRQIGETSLNETSSRSHQIIRLTIESSARKFDNSSILTASVNFIDLAGSERASQSLAAGTRLKEGCHINRSLLTLGTVIRKLSKGRSGHIPFRDSKLTRILQSSLGGNARTAIICTMSPARSHVEQSRNTLLFASCAKEVSTNAQVNVVMSDKALIRHLQRELIRLESELRSPSTTLLTSNYAAVLQEKDRHIEKLENEIKDLILERDIAKAQVQDLRRVIEEKEHLLMRLGSGNYPHLRVKRSPDSEISMPETSIVEDPRSLDDGFRKYGSTRYSCRQSEISSDENYIEIPDFEGRYMQSVSSPRLIISHSHLSESDSCQGWDDVEEQSTANSQDLCKEVRCIETEESCTRIYVQSSCLSPDEKIGISAWPVLMDRSEEFMSPMLNREEEMVTSSSKEDREVVTSSLKEDKDTAESSCKEDRELTESIVKEDREAIPTPCDEVAGLSFIHTSTFTSTENSSPWSDHQEELSTSISLKLHKSRSCKASFPNSKPSQRFEDVQNNEKTPPNALEKDFIGRPMGLPKKISTLNYGAESENLSRKASQTSLGTIVLKDYEAQEKAEVDEDSPTLDMCTAGMEETTVSQHDKEVFDYQVMKTEAAAIEPSKKVKNVGLDPIESSTISNWHSEFERLQTEIIGLWHSCFVSLAHRTQFFLLFKGDPTDSIYMEVELRRLSFLQNALFRGNWKMEDDQTLTVASSTKALRRERQMLSKQMQKKLSEQEREGLYLRWGIGLSTKYRKVQLANRLWNKTDDLDHIADSAAVVAKLVGLVDSEQAPKEMFGLNFASRPPRRSYSSFKRSLMPLY